MPLRRIVQTNCIIVFAVGIFGFVSDQPYWKEVGTVPWISDYLYWFALLLNGASGFISAYLSAYITDVFQDVINRSGLTQVFDFRFTLQYTLWLLSIYPQWFIYERLADWAMGTPQRIAPLYVAAFALAAGGCGLAARSLMWNISYSEESGLFVNLYEGPVLILAAAISDLWVVALILLKSRAGLRAE